MPRPSSATVTMPSLSTSTKICVPLPATASSTELSSASQSRCTRPPMLVEPMYMAGRRRMAWMPSRTWISRAEYEFLPREKSSAPLPLVRAESVEAEGEAIVRRYRCHGRLCRGLDITNEYRTRVRLVGGRIVAGMDVPAGSIVVDFDVAVPLRDGVRLRANVFRPREGQWPVLLTRLPYGKDLPIGSAVIDPVQAA